MLRWLLPVVAALSLVGTSVTSWAAAGVVGDPSCCCPVKAKCKCHDHDKQPDPTAKIKRCGDVVKLVAPALLAAIAPEPHVPVIVPRVVTAAAPALSAIPDDLPRRPETPPF